MNNDLNNDKIYKSVCTKIGFTVLLNLLLLQTLTAVFMLISGAVEGNIARFADYHGFSSSDMVYAFKETMYLIAYLLSFLLPAFFFRLISKRDMIEPMRLGIKVSADLPIMVLAGVGMVLPAAYINSLLVSFMDFSPLLEAEPLDTPVKALLSFVSIAIVPALCEEFLFRGCILSNLLPYGKTVALIASSVLFSMMHGNPMQFFYTFVAGLVLGYVYIESGSIWPSTFIHLFNNFFSVAESIIADNNAGDNINFILLSVETLLIIGAFTYIGWKIYIKSKEGGKHTFGAHPTTRRHLSKTVAIKGFFRPTIIVYIALTVELSLMLVLIAFVYKYS